MKKVCSLDKKYAKGGSFNLLEELINNDILDEENPLYDQAKESLKNNDTDAMLYVMDEMIQADMIDSSYPDYKAIKKAIKENSEKEFKAFLKDPNLKKQYANYKKLPGADLTFNKYAKELFEYDKHADGGKIKSNMQKIGGIKGLEGWMPGVKFVYYDNQSDKFYYPNEDDLYELKNTSTLEKLHSFLKEKNIFLNKLIYNYKGLEVDIRPGSNKHYIVWGIKSDQKFSNEKFKSFKEAEDFVKENKMVLVRKKLFVGGGFEELSSPSESREREREYDLPDDLLREWKKHVKENSHKWGEEFEYEEDRKIAADDVAYEYYKGIEDSFDRKEFVENAVEKMLESYSGGGLVSNKNAHDISNKSVDDVAFLIKACEDDDVGTELNDRETIMYFDESELSDANRKKVQAIFGKKSDGGVIDSRITLLKKMDAKNPSATLKARIKLLEKMGKKKTEPEYSWYVFGEFVEDDSQTPSGAWEDMYALQGKDFKKRSKAYDLKIRPEDKNKYFYAGYDTNNGGVDLKNMMAFDKPLDKRQMADDSGEPITYADATDEKPKAEPKAEPIILYSLNEVDEGGKPELIEGLAEIKYNPNTKRKDVREEDFIAAIKKAVRGVRGDSKLTFNEELDFDSLDKGIIFTTTDEDEDERTWFVEKITEPKPKPEPKEPKKDTDWKSLFANPERFQKYGGEFLYPPRAENKIRPVKVMFDRVDNNTFIAEPKLNGSASSITIFENTVVVKERHNTFFATPPTFDFQALHRGKGAMCIVGEFMNKSKKDKDGKPFRGFCIWDITAYEGQILIGSTIEERLKLIDKLYPTKGVIQTKAGNDLLYITEVPDIYKVAIFDKNFENLFKELTQIDMIEGFVLKRKNARLEMMTSEINNGGSFVKMRKPTANYEF